MKKVTFAILGMGNRGGVYARNLVQYTEQAEIVAVADPRQSCLDTANGYLHLPEDRLFHSAEELLAQPKLADIMIIATQDAQHRDHAVAAMEKGYDLMLEKPISTNPAEVKEIEETALRLGKRVIVTHELRFTTFYRKIKELLDAGVVGRVLHLNAAEHVNCLHMAHAYVRGHWRRKEDSSPIILAKCSHDMDLILWLTGKKCLSVSSIGSLDYFTRENMPEGAPERCTEGCPVAETCPYHSLRFYLPRIPNWPTHNMHPAPNEENIRRIIDTTNYGKCVFQMDNNVPDHQHVQMLLEGNITASFSMDALNTRGSRTIRIGGTEGELWGDLNEKKIYLRKHGQKVQEFDLANEVGGGGHQGGDEALVKVVIDYFCSGENIPSLTTIDRSAESHYVAFAAEESRLRGGEKITMKDFV